jgi:hypothetical protein
VSAVPHEVEARAEGHTNATLEQRVVRGFVRDDPDWRPAIVDVLAVAYRVEPDTDALVSAIDAAMMRAIHAAARTGALHDLGIVAVDSKNPLRRLAWRLVGAPRAAARARRFNRESAAIAAKED